MTEITPKVAALYARVSTSHQEEEQTIDSQVSEIVGKIKADGNLIHDDLIFKDDGWTGEMLQRPALDQMRDAAREGKFQILYVYDRGRLSRVFAYQEVILEELREWGIEFNTLHDVAAQTAEERVLQAMQGVFHEYERVKIAERMRRGKLYRAKQGKVISSDIRYGYKFEVDENGAKRVVVDEEEAEVVRMIWNWVAKERHSVYKVAKRLTEMGIKTPSGKIGMWSKTTIHSIITCETYVSGIWHYNKTEATLPKKKIDGPVAYRKVKRTSRRTRNSEEWIKIEVPIIVEEAWMYEKIQQVLEYNQKYAPKNYSYEYLLSGLVYCECGQRRTGDGANAHGHRYYRCIERLLNQGERKCKAHGANAVIVDSMVWKELEKNLKDEKMLKKQANIWMINQAKKHLVSQVDIDKLSKQLDKTKQEEIRYIKAYGEGLLEPDQFEQVVREVKQKRKGYEAKLAGIQKQSPSAMGSNEDLVKRLCDEAKRVIDEMMTTDQKVVIHDIIDKVIIHDAGEVEVHAHLPANTEKVGYGTEYRNRWSTKCGEEYAV